MAEVISLFNHPDFDLPYAGCTECGGDDWKMLLTADGELGIAGFQCSNIDCAVVGLFDKDRDVIVFEFDHSKEDQDDD